MTSVLRVFYWLLQWTWGIVQNVAGLFVFLFCRGERAGTYKGAVVKRWRAGGSMGLGMFIFLGNVGSGTDFVLAHEYGHTLQSIILGPLFLPVIGLPSLMWASLPVFRNYREKRSVSYYSLYTEAWANSLGVKKKEPPKP